MAECTAEGQEEPDVLCTINVRVADIIRILVDSSIIWFDFRLLEISKGNTGHKGDTLGCIPADEFFAFQTEGPSIDPLREGIPLSVYVEVFREVDLRISPVRPWEQLLFIRLNHKSFRHQSNSGNELLILDGFW
jgi:hypothetical protein